jgi:hypothetical protein
MAIRVAQVKPGVPAPHICSLAMGCTVPECYHKKPHRPNRESDFWGGFCHEVALECGNDNKTPCLCVPVKA